MARNIKYSKLKYILSKFCDGLSKKENIIDHEASITKDNVQDAITVFKKINIIKKNGINGENKIIDNLFDKSFFSNTKYNQIVISSIAHTQDEFAKESLKYIFNDVSKRIVKSTVLKYQKRFDDSLLSLIDSEKYQKILSIIEHNQKEAFKLMYEVVFEDKLKHELIPADIIILDDKWFLFSFNVISQEYQFDDSSKIFSFEYKSDVPKMFAEKEIEDKIDEFVGNTNIIEIEVKLKAETLNSLIKLNLIEDYSIFKATEEDVNLSFMMSNQKEFKKIHKVYTNSTELRKRFDFVNMDFTSKTYLIKVKIKKINLKTLLQLYPNIFENTKANSNIIRYCKCCNKPISDLVESFS